MNKKTTGILIAVFITAALISTLLLMATDEQIFTTAGLIFSLMSACVLAYRIFAFDLKLKIK